MTENISPLPTRKLGRVRLTHERKAVAIASLANAGGKLLGWSLAVFVAGQIIKHRGADVFAHFAIVMTFAAMGALLDLGGTSAFAEYSSRLNVKDFAGVDALLSACRRQIRNGVSLFALIAGGGITLLQFVSPSALSFRLLWCSVAAMTAMGGAQYFIVEGRMFAAMMKDYVSSLNALVVSVTASVVAVACATKTSMGGEFIGLTSALCSAITYAALITWHRRGMLSRRSAANEHNIDWKNIRSFALKCSALSIGSSIGGTMDTVLVCIALSLHETARYNLGYRVFIGVSVAQISANQLWPLVARKWASGEVAIRRGVIKKLYAISFTVGAVAAMVAAIGLVAASRYFHIGFKYSIEELSAFCVLSIAGGMGGVSVVLGARERTMGGLLWIQSIYCIVAIALKLIIAAHFGLVGFLWGAAIASVLAYHVPTALYVMRMSSKV